MANALPPPPIKAPDGSYAWLDWYNKLQLFVSQGGVVPWANIDFTGSSIGDIANRNHALLTALQGGTTGEYYHLTAAEHALAAAYTHNSLNALQGGAATQYYHLTSAQHNGVVLGQFPFTASASDPTGANIPSGSCAVYKNTTSGLVKLWANDGGTMKSVTLT